MRRPVDQGEAGGEEKGGLMMKLEPTSEHDWTIHSINIHGVFFERWCQHTLAKAKGWRVKSTNYPVEWRGKESTLDIRAQYEVNQRILTLLLECKKNNPNFVNWVFFPKTDLSGGNSIFLSRLAYVPFPESRPGWDVQTSMIDLRVSPRFADEARETRNGYLDFKAGEKTKTSNVAIADAAYQVALATQFVYSEETQFSRTLGSSSTVTDMQCRSQIILPMIVTSAQLFTCDFDPTDVDPATGELAYSKAHLTAVPAVIYEYPLPRFLYNAPGDIVATLTSGAIEMFVRRHILVVHSGNLSQVLDEVAQWI